MSSTQLLVLGVVRMSAPVHGYDVRRTLPTWRADEWVNVNPGSIYHALKTLTRDGFVRVAETGRRGSRPEPLYAGLAFVTALHASVSRGKLRCPARLQQIPPTSSRGWWD